MEHAEFISYKNGYYTFRFQNGEDMVFEEVHPKVLKQFDLKSDKNYIGKVFKVTFTEHFEDDEDFIIYRIEHLKPIE